MHKMIHWRGPQYNPATMVGISMYALYDHELHQKQTDRDRDRQKARNRIRQKFPTDK